MRAGQIGRRGCSWTALAGAALLLAACQAPLSSDSSKHATTQPARPILSGDPAAFIGVGEAELSRTLGEPKQVRKDEPAEIWQYYGAECVVDFYLYDGDTGLAVAYLEARNQAAESTPADRCVKSLLQSVSAELQQTSL